jgi:hypothetical protein
VRTRQCWSINHDENYVHGNADSDDDDRYDPEPHPVGGEGIITTMPTIQAASEEWDDYNDSADDTATSTKIVPTIQATPQTPTTRNPSQKAMTMAAAKKTSSLLATKTVPTVQAMPTIHDNSSEEDFVPADDNGSADDTGNTGNKF